VTLHKRREILGLIVKSEKFASIVELRSRWVKASGPTRLP
jgi:hypothetical protein